MPQCPVPACERHSQDPDRGHPRHHSRRRLGLPGRRVRQCRRRGRALLLPQPDPARLAQDRADRRPLQLRPRGRRGRHLQPAAARHPRHQQSARRPQRHLDPDRRRHPDAVMPAGTPALTQGGNGFVKFKGAQTNVDRTPRMFSPGADEVPNPASDVLLSKGIAHHRLRAALDRLPHRLAADDPEEQRRSPPSPSRPTVVLGGSPRPTTTSSRSKGRPATTSTSAGSTAGRRRRHALHRPGGRGRGRDRERLLRLHRQRRAAAAAPRHPAAGSLAARDLRHKSGPRRPHLPRPRPSPGTTRRLGRGTSTAPPTSPTSSRR